MQVTAEANALDGADGEATVVDFHASPARRGPKLVAQRRVAKRARAALLKWLRGVAEAAVVAA